MESLACFTCSIKIGYSYFNSEILSEGRWFLITDSNLERIYSNQIKSWGFEYYSIPAGEAYKSRRTKELIENFLLSRNCNKSSGLIGFGGGVVSDIVGFVASTYMRGIKFVLVPTSLLAMVDSSVGGKNAVDTAYGKNLIGTIYRPAGVYIDLIFLKSLPRDLWSAGMSEVIKMATALDLSFYELLKSKSLNDVINDAALAQAIVKKSIELKINIVEKDENESQLRMVLNFGHTVGHAIESETEMNHGLCVSIGIYTEIEIANFLGYSNINLEEIKDLLTQYELPYTLPYICIDNIISKMKLDKKRRTNDIPIYVPYEIGSILPSPILVTESNYRFFLSNTTTIAGIPEFNDLEIPGSKSLTNRFLLLSALCRSTTKIKSGLLSEDTQIMTVALKNLKICSISTYKNDFEVTGMDWEEGSKDIYVGNAGTAARFLTAICALLPGETVIHGSSRMHERPIKDLVDAINSIKPQCTYLSKEGYLPILVKGEPSQGGRITLNCSLSSQYASSILMAAPLAKNDTELILTGDSEPVSISYIQMTVQAMKLFGAQIETKSDTEYYVKATGYSSPGEILVEPDATSASYFFALAALHKKTIEIQGLGSESIQGELEFVEVLRKMGCEVCTTKNTTKVTGKDLRSVQVNMNRCTDSSLTAAILMATCDGISEITGIDNQQVKECNRLDALIKELGKTGVLVEKIENGIRIHRNTSLNGNYPINTYGDQRIAMSFAVLGTVVKGLSIKNKQVVNKTFPSYWKCLSKLGLSLSGSQNSQEINNVIIVGMRYAGKTTVGSWISEELGWELVDIDQYIKSYLKIDNLSSWIHLNGMNAFREHEYNALKLFVAKPATVIVTGGGIIENPKSLLCLKSHYPVIWISTTVENLVLNSQTIPNHTPTIDISKVYESRKGYYKYIHDYRFYYTSRDLTTIKNNINLFLYKVLREKSQLPPDFSCFGTVSETTDKSLVRDLQGLTGLEIRADMFAKVQRSYRALGRMKELVPGVQTIYTLRAAVDSTYWKTLKNALKWCPDYIDVQFENTSKWVESFNKLVSKAYSTRLILSYHTETSEDLDVIYNRMKSFKPDILKFISPLQVPKSLQKEIIFQLGEENIVSRVQNTYFSPVKIDTPLGKGQLSYHELTNYQLQLKIKPTELKFYLAGNPIKKSPAYNLYNSLFKQYGLEYSYEYLELELSYIINTLKSPFFLGASVTIPFKEEIIPYLDDISVEAKAIGSVNTVVRYKNYLVGHNTDWLGLYHPLKRTRRTFKRACVLGAGGTSKSALYALKRLGIDDVILWNRSMERIQKHNWPCPVTNNLKDIEGIDLIFSTLPGVSEVELPWLNQNSVVVEAAYFPQPTFIGAQAIKAGALVITGKEMYLHMARHQFMIFTGRNVSLEMVKKHLVFNI
jgi:pentafunctional AROM polypeptide